MADYYTKTSGYGKWPLWQWIFIYIVIGGIIYALLYYFILAKNGDYANLQQQYPSPKTQQSATTEATQSSAPISNNIYISKTDSSKGTYMTDLRGMTLYTYDKDTTGVSNCYNGCAKAWPIYSSNAAAQLPDNISIVKRTGGTSQYAYKGMPLYHYATDVKVGDTIGDNIGNVWHIVKL